MTVRVAEDNANDALAAMLSPLDAGKLRVYTGAQPANVSDAATGTLLVEFTLADPAFAPPALAEADLNGGIDATATGTGTAGWCRLLTSANVAVMDASTTEVVLDSNSITTGDTVSLESFNVALPAGQAV